MDTLTIAERSERMARVRSHDTKPEIALRKLVWGMGYRYRKNPAIVPGRPDLSFAGRKRAIFLYGCFWHRHNCASGRRVPKTRVSFWSEKFERNVARDAEVGQILTASGWKRLVVWECELKRQPELVAHRVRGFLDA